MSEIQKSNGEDEHWRRRPCQTQCKLRPTNQLGRGEDRGARDEKHTKKVPGRNNDSEGKGERSGTPKFLQPNGTLATSGVSV